MKSPEERIAELEAALEAALESGYSADHWDAVEVVQEQHLAHLESMYYQQDQLFRGIDEERSYSRFLEHMVKCSMSENDKKIIKNMVATSKFFDVPLQAIMHWARDNHPEVFDVTTRYYVIDVVKLKIIDTAGGEPYFEYGDYIKEGDDFLKNSEGKNLKDALNE